MYTVRGHGCRFTRESPSFSSTLLDAIYRSIDERDDEEPVVYRETMAKNRGDFAVQGIIGCFEDAQQRTAGLRRATSIDQKRRVGEKAPVRRKSAADFETSSRQSYFNSSAGGGFFGSSEVESIYGVRARPKPIRTSTHQDNEFNGRERKRSTYDQKYQSEDLQRNPKREGNFVKTKSRALKIYGDLKKTKQPISPGGRLATFLNSLFTAGNAKKAKISSLIPDDATNHLDRNSKSAIASSCSSASSVSRSCLSNTPSSRGKLSNGVKRSVRFYPVSIIVDEHCKPCGHKSLHEDESDSLSVKSARNFMNEELKLHLNQKNSHVGEAAMNLLKNYENFDSINNNVNSHGNDVYMNDEDDDAASYASSDLFELDNLSAVGMERFCQELPVYETTHLDTNRAIADGLIS